MATQVKDTLASALASAFAEIEGATKDKANPAFKSKYADLSAVIDAIKPALVAHRLFFTQMTHEAEGGVCIETQVRHESGESLSFGKLFVPASKRDAHGFGSALTYARRYSLMTAFGVPAEDDDGNAAAKTVGTGAPRNGHIDDAEWAALTTLMQTKGVSSQRFCKKYDIGSVKELPSRLYRDAMDSLSALPMPAKEKEPA